MSLLKDLSGNQEWQGLLKAAEKMIPSIPEFDPAKPESIEDWKHKSGMRAGFELCLQIFNPGRKPKE